MIKIFSTNMLTLLILLRTYAVCQTLGKKPIPDLTGAIKKYIKVQSDGQVINKLNMPTGLKWLLVSVTLQ